MIGNNYRATYTLYDKTWHPAGRTVGYVDTLWGAIELWKQYSNPDFIAVKLETADSWRKQTIVWDSIKEELSKH